MRYELKYLVPEKDISRCFSIVWQHPASFLEEFPDREINNIYLDTPELISFREGQSGISERKKYRIRWYGDWDVIRHPVLEIKIKENQVGSKQHFNLSPFSFEHLPLVLQELKENFLIPPTFAVSSSNRYQRSYFKSFCGRFRITIDRNLLFATPFDGFLKPAVAGGLVVLELKYKASDDDQADWIKQFIPILRTKFSKYGEAFERVCSK